MHKYNKLFILTDAGGILNGTLSTVQDVMFHKMRFISTLFDAPARRRKSDGYFLIFFTLMLL